MSYRYNKNIRVLVLLCFLMSSMQPVSAQTAEEQTVLAALTLNIVKLTTWQSEDQPQGDNVVNLCLIGDNVVQQAFSSIDRKTFAEKTLKVINLSRLMNLSQCQVLYVSELRQNLLQQVFIELNKQPVLTIGESREFAQKGGMVALENIGGKINLFVNLAAVRQSDLKISSRLLKLAHIVDKAD